MIKKIVSFAVAVKVGSRLISEMHYDVIMQEHGKLRAAICNPIIYLRREFFGQQYLTSPESGR